MLLYLRELHILTFFSIIVHSRALNKQIVDVHEKEAGRKDSVSPRERTAPAGVSNSGGFPWISLMVRSKAKEIG